MSRIIIFFLMIMMSWSCSQKTEQASDQPTQITLESVKLTDLNGNPVALADIKDKVIFLNFWATWCKPCLQEMPSIMSLREKLSNQPIEFYFASDEELERIKNFTTKKNMNGNFLYVENSEQLGIQALPTTFIFNAKGELVHSEMGFKTWDDPAVVEMINNIIAQ